MNDSLLLLSSFIKKPKETGAVAPSSKSLTKEIIKNIDFKSSRNIVELGPGLGTFTKAILKRANLTTKLFCFAHFIGMNHKRNHNADVAMALLM